MKLLDKKEIENYIGEIETLKCERRLITKTSIKLEQKMEQIKDKDRQIEIRYELLKKIEKMYKFHEFIKKFGAVERLIKLLGKTIEADKIYLIEQIEEGINKQKELCAGLEPIKYIMNQVTKNNSSIFYEIQKESKNNEQELRLIIETIKKEQEKSKAEKAQKEFEERFGRELYTDEDVLRYGNTPGNIANGGGFCDYIDKVCVEFENGTTMEYDKITKKMRKVYVKKDGYAMSNISYIDGELFYRKSEYSKVGVEQFKYYKQFSSKKFEWRKQIIYNNKLYFMDKKSEYRIYCSNLLGENIEEISNEAPPVNYQNNLQDFTFGSGWIYYDSISGLTRINLVTKKAEILKYKDYINYICSAKGVYFLEGDIGINERLKYFSHDNPQHIIQITNRTSSFNLHRKKIVFLIEGQGIYTCNPDGSNTIKICECNPYYDIFIIEDLIYFIDAGDGDAQDYYRISIDGTGLKRLKEGEPLYI